MLTFYICRNTGCQNPNCRLYQSFLCIGIYGFDDSAISVGRLFGGCALFWRTNIVVTCNSHRICALRICSHNWKLLLINCYLPYENSADSVDLLADDLITIETLIASNSDCDVVLGGHLNVDFARV